MAQDTWINIALSAGTGEKAKHTSVGGANGSGDVTFSYDKAKLTTLNQADAILAQIRGALLGAGFK
jgi:hypothetical protein